MSQNLREQMFQAMKAAWRDRAMSVSFDVTWRAVTDAAWAVVGPELDRLRAEVAASRAAHLADYGALDQQIGEMQAERDVLRARLAKVEALADEWAAWSCRSEEGHEDSDVQCVSCLSADLRAALASVPEPSDSGPVRATGAIVTERQRCICAVICLDHCRACNYSGRDLEEGCIRLDADEDEPSDSEPAPDADREAGERDPWCRADSCTWRNWRSGGMPTHRRGEDCPTDGAS